MGYLRAAYAGKTTEFPARAARHEEDMSYSRAVGSSGTATEARNYRELIQSNRTFGHDLNP